MGANVTIAADRSRPGNSGLKRCSPAARASQARGTATRKPPFGARADAISMSGFWVCTRAEPDGQRDRLSWKLRDHESVPLICPMCQNVFAGKASMRATPFFARGSFLCMELFSMARLLPR